MLPFCWVRRPQPPAHFRCISQQKLDDTSSPPKQGCAMNTSNSHGRWLPLSTPRRLICDLMHFARKVPTVPVQRRMNLATVMAAREQAEPRPSWCAIFTKALAFAAVARPELRRAHLPFPRPHLYQTSQSVASDALGPPTGAPRGG